MWIRWECGWFASFTPLGCVVEEGSSVTAVPLRRPDPLQVERPSSRRGMGQHPHGTVSFLRPTLKVAVPVWMTPWRPFAQMLNCILSMVEKTRKALGILQQRSNESRHEMSGSSSSTSSQQQQWKRRGSSTNQETVYEASELRRQAGELIAHTLKATEDRVSQVKRKAGSYYSILPWKLMRCFAQNDTPRFVSEKASQQSTKKKLLFFSLSL